MSDLSCPECGNELEYKDYFGKRTEWNEWLNEPIISHEGDIYYCETCEQSYYTVDGVNGIHEGYPCQQGERKVERNILCQ